MIEYNLIFILYLDFLKKIPIIKAVYNNKKRGKKMDYIHKPGSAVDLILEASVPADVNARFDEALKINESRHILEVNVGEVSYKACRKTIPLEVLKKAYFFEFQNSTPKTQDIILGKDKREHAFQDNFNSRFLLVSFERGIEIMGVLRLREEKARKISFDDEVTCLGEPKTGNNTSGRCF